MHNVDCYFSAVSHILTLPYHCEKMLILLTCKSQWEGKIVWKKNVQRPSSHRRDTVPYNCWHLHESDGSCTSWDRHTVHSATSGVLFPSQRHAATVLLQDTSAKCNVTYSIDCRVLKKQDNIVDYRYFLFFMRYRYYWSIDQRSFISTHLCLMLLIPLVLSCTWNV